MFIKKYLWIIIIAVIYFSPFGQVGLEGSVSASEQVDSIWYSTDWGEEDNGLRIKVGHKKNLFYGESAEFFVEFLASKDLQEISAGTQMKMPVGSKAILKLYDIRTGKEWHYWINNCFQKLCNLEFYDMDFFIGSILSDTLDLLYRLDSGKTTFRPMVRVPAGHCDYSSDHLVTIWKSHPAGSYKGRIELFSPMSEPEYWHGWLVSPTFDIAIGEETFTTDTVAFYAPASLKLFPGLEIGYDDSEMVKIDVRRGFFTGSTTSSLGIISLFGGKIKRIDIDQRALPNRGNILFEDGFYCYVCKVEVFETSNAPGHMWSPRSGHGYRTLWSREYNLKISKEEYDSLQIRDEDIYDYHTILIPQKVRLKDNVAVLFDDRHSMPMLFRIKKNSNIFTAFFQNNKLLEIRKGFDNSMPLNLPMKVVCDSVFNLQIAMFQDTAASVAGTKNLFCDFLWKGACKLKCPDKVFDIQHEKVPSITTCSPPFRTIKMPRNLVLSDDLLVAYNDSDCISLEYKHADLMHLIRFTIYYNVDCGGHSQIVKSYPTILPNPLIEMSATGNSWHKRIKCKIELVAFTENKYEETIAGNGGSILWSREYYIPLSDKQMKELKKRKK